ncbi:MBL fold metallo-hydrolase [Tepidibacter formicigenes]|jgi:glyoxylase-like metal-dependent hydrolase (beta-lactamase superfamily II)|uniref:Glyoxylase, beta-lactamase superfamily II n=1 Tax=Tepidibacter formicigenes DSM 15518 TaxID=1123349 RepID=A0A1M6TVD8_9FIRM|nr:MBL fold metallo-hydrolase [Tepidibacter formicigenes]SHK60911.1 Glyoxylase, beta-lactamase superfamily II [Tepidibacter formicigenes DSM 15518]
MVIKRFVVGNVRTNSYIVYDENTLDAIIIDPGANPKMFIRYIDKNKLRLKEIILTHYHYDHIGAVEILKNMYNCSIAIHKKDVEGLKDPNTNLSRKVFRKPISITADKVLLEGDVITFGDIKLKVIHTPGHTEGSISLKVENENIIFTGDAIFCDCIGRWDLKGGSEEKTRNTIINIISKWEDEVKIYSGHGEIANMEYVRRENKEFLYILNN